MVHSYTGFGSIFVTENQTIELSFFTVNKKFGASFLKRDLGILLPNCKMRPGTNTSL